MLEVFTVGGGEYLVNTFNAVAAWTGGGGYRSMIRVVMVMGLVYSLLVLAFTLNVRAGLNWFLQATAIYLCLMVPTVDIKVTDRINPSLAPATVANVPLGLGVLASFTTQIGDYLTRTAETVFAMPTELAYSSNGLVYGARLFDATRGFTIRDAEFSANLDQYMKQCVFGDIMLYRKSLTDLAKATDLWGAIASDTQSRSQEWLERSGGTVTPYIVTCSQAYGMLDAQWGSMIDANSRIWGLEVYPKLSETLAQAKLRHDVPVVNQAFTQASGGFVEAARQNSAIHAFMQARNNMSGSTIDAFAQTRADMQARNTYSSIAQQAMTWVPILNIVLTVVFFAMFPVLFPLFLMPQTGVVALKGYATGFFYLAAWGPLYVILHMICMTRAESAAAGIARGGVSLGTYAGIGAVNAETATIAGFMLMSVPFLAAGLARGAMSIAGQSMSMLAPAQNAAEAAALEQTTGNYAYGNVSWANQTSNMRQSDQWSTAPSYQTGASAFSVRQDNGATVSSYGSGQEVIDTSQAISRLGFTPTASTGFVSELREQAHKAHRQAQAYRAAANDILTSTHTDRSASGVSTEKSTGWDSSVGRSSNTSMEEYDRSSGSSSSGFDQRSSTGLNQSVSRGRNWTNNWNEQVGGSLGGQVGLGGKAGGVGKQGSSGLGSNLSGQVGFTVNQNDQLSDARKETRHNEEGGSIFNGVRDEHSTGNNISMSDITYERDGAFSRASITDSSSQGREDALSKARSYQESAEELEELSRQLSSDASYAETHGMQLSENLSQELAQWYRMEQSNNPGLDAPELWATELTQHQQMVRDSMINRWMGEKQELIRHVVQDSLHEPEMVEVPHRRIGGYGDVRGSYHPYGVEVLPDGPDLGNFDGVPAFIEQGKRSYADEKKVAQASHAERIRAGAGVQSSVNRETGRKFFQALPPNE
ncbi:conjugal transfer protein TraG N-terminal domain-containing protein [Sphingobium baderi]|uniref:conjugal transfer protein TraG N-terminal domain-containing protein n=1 Tax=Sphingobium baderi TaxID=1332080 RepID=UPI002B404EA1|nr:conjugal transfer protein TraG N-terminal domain-containing protein [Sphingobium baderi]WRD78822.1 conjugal transfer protein TraG N-terminal domain-containing protein [Sphingobium baderi]